MIETFKDQALRKFSADPRIGGVLLTGSLAVGQADRFSDLDLIVVVRDEAYAEVMAERPAFAAILGDLLASFTGEHVGEPRLLICLYAMPIGDGLLHVDLKFVQAADLVMRVDEPLVLYDPDGLCAGVLSKTEAIWPERDPQWFEDRFWIWLHYAAARLARGERFEALSTVNWIREQVLAPLAARRAGVPQRGLRHIESGAPASIRSLDATVSLNDSHGLWNALNQCAGLYLDLRSDALPSLVRSEAEQRVRTYLSICAARGSSS